MLGASVALLRAHGTAKRERIIDTCAVDTHISHMQALKTLPATWLKILTQCFWEGVVLMATKAF